MRAKDSAGNEDPNEVRVTVRSAATDLVVAETSFELDSAQWAVASPDNAQTGNWEWGDPDGTDFQPEDCATGLRCWITGLPATLPGGGNNDVDAGQTTLLSRYYDMSSMVDPLVRYARWFTNDRGASPGEDPLIVEVSDGGAWVPLESVGAGTPLAWVETELPFPSAAALTESVRFRFIAADLGNGSLVEAGIDDFQLIDRGQGCRDCSAPAPPVGKIRVSRNGQDVVLDWTDDPAPGTRFVIYKLLGPAFDQPVRIGTTDARSFVHAGAAQSPESFAYRVSTVNVCGTESALE